MSFEIKKFVITAGPTREWFDPVRFISNPSSGKMGIALADAASSRGYKTELIHGPIVEKFLQNKKYSLKDVDTTNDMLEAVLNSLECGTVLIMAAAPADYAPKKYAAQKIKKSGDEIVMELIPTPDILLNVKTLRENNPEMNDKIMVIGFAAETENIIKHAEEKLKRKKLDLICVNDVSKDGCGFSTETNQLCVIDKFGKMTELPAALKSELAVMLIDLIENFNRE